MREVLPMGGIEEENHHGIGMQCYKILTPSKEYRPLLQSQVDM